MLFAVNLFLLICLSVVVVQDFKQRQISWFLIPLLVVDFVCKALLTGTCVALVGNSLFNLGFLIIQIVMLTIYMSLKNKRLVNIVNTYLGIGDVLFFVVVCFAFSPANYIVFYLSSTILTLIGFLIYRLVSKEVSKEIPLAGSMAAVLVGLMVLNQIMPQINFYKDDYVLTIINRL